jgi:hypothetical protein
MSSDTCNATTADGTPCENSACRSDGRCWIHTQTDESADIGRDTKLSLERQEQIATAIEQGKSLTSAARMAGVNRSSVYEWLDRGEADIESGKDNVFTDFYHRVTRARGHGEDFYFELALELARENGDHQFIASLMKQRYPDSWGETETGVSSPDIEISVSEATYETWQ